ncbi:YscO family type III secretion system apparatus protein [Mesorhizobium sp. ANAO-SY3R2]|uniref:type III secretion system stalk subunit SctO n=1 Tax=Mesorhizobium sp. ANAO-SY3R2 TaxID=3166644 RepID=UPI00366C5F5E
MKMLLRVKELKEEQAMRAMQAKRQQFDSAQRQRVSAEADVTESAATLPSRENAIYAEILGKIVDQDEIDQTKGRVVQLEKEHGALKDIAERCRHVEHRLEGELESATLAYRYAQKKRDKFQIVTDDLVSAAAVEAEHREEVEVEDLFSRPRARMA